MDRETLLDVAVNAVPMAILVFFIGLFLVYMPFPPDTLAFVINHGLTIVPLLSLAVLTYVSAKVISRDEGKTKQRTDMAMGIDTEPEPSALESGEGSVVEEAEREAAVDDGDGDVNVDDETDGARTDTGASDTESTETAASDAEPTDDRTNRRPNRPVGPDGDPTTASVSRTDRRPPRRTPTPPRRRRRRTGRRPHRRRPTAHGRFGPRAPTPSTPSGRSDTPTPGRRGRPCSGRCERSGACPRRPR